MRRQIEGGKMERRISGIQASQKFVQGRTQRVDIGAWRGLGLAVLLRGRIASRAQSGGIATLTRLKVTGNAEIDQVGLLLVID